MNELYQKINNYVYEIRMIELDEYLNGMNRKKIDIKKAYDIITNSESNAILNFWKGRFADPCFKDPRSSLIKCSRVEKNKSMANEFYRKALDLNIEGMAEAGDKYGQVCLGEMYEYGYYIYRDDSTALNWYRKAAEQGYAAAHFNIGRMYENGKGVDENYMSAAEWYRKAAEKGHAHAQFYLGNMYHAGYCVNQNHSTAVEWYRKATKQGHVIAQFNLYRCMNTVSV